ncbi:MAG: LLM class flavin-dependent oxidoreductase [Chloroflexi bacterium]|nr:LLM class flavin-dependent oxidoreductase [Chloroflexota bacterium]
MAELVRRVGLGLAARGDVSDTIEWVRRARDAGLQEVWFHDSYFERDAVTYATAVASHVEGIRVGLGALNPYTRHPVLIAMTVSALDEIAPERISLALGSALPLRLGQMAIPYDPKDAASRVSEAIDTVRKLWAGERLPPARAGLPPLQPMFAPVHRVPIYVAGYRTPMMELAGQKADGYIARPAESVAGLRYLLRKMRRAAKAAGRDPDAIDTTGYLLTLVDRTRREALNRAKREPFVIYMMSILSDVTITRAGFEPAMRDAIAAKWRAEDYHGAGQLIPDELLDAFILCGTVDEVAARAAEYAEAGMKLPLLQPVVQDEDQTELAIRAAVAYGSARTLRVAARQALEAQRMDVASRLGRRFSAYTEIARPFSFTASVTPVAAGGAMAALHGGFDAPLFFAALLGSVTLHIGTNVINEIFDVRKGVDSITSPRASHALVKGRVSEREAFALAITAFAVATLVGVGLVAVRGWPIVGLGLLGLVGGHTYTAPPFEYKFHALGLPLVFLLMGPLMVGGAYFAITGALTPEVFWVSLPVGLLVTAILHGNEWRDITEDARVIGTATFAARFGRRVSHWTYVALVVGAYMALAVGVVLGVVPAYAVLAVLSLPFLVRVIRASELGSQGQQRAIAMIDIQTAQLHAAFGALLVAGILAAALLR